MRVTLTVVEGPHVGSTFAFVEHEAFLVGRSPEVQFRLPLRDKTLSRVHFLIEVDPPSCRLMDMASTNGVRVNGARVFAADLRHGDRIQAGSTVLAFAVEESEPAPSVDGPEPQLDDDVDPYATTVPVMGRVIPTADHPRFPGFRIERRLGEGSTGVVHLARREADDVPVALKERRPGFVSNTAAIGQFLREATILRQLEHPNIVRFHEIGFASGRLYFAMEYVEGTTVAETLKAQGPFSIPTVAGLACQLLRALDYAHAKGFVHRDIKPANILTTKKNGRSLVKLADFGLGKLYQESNPNNMTLTGPMGGTLAFMPPEQIAEFGDAKPPADIYALGASLYNLLTGRPLFELRGGLHQQLELIRFGEPDPIRSHRPEVPDEFAQAIHKAIAKEPANRFPNARAMRDALAPFAKASPTKEDAHSP
jgi:eukaryotic-like serine/threonine-protein kinase